MWWPLGKPTYTITYDKLWPWQKIAKTFPCRFNGEITRRAYIFFCLCVIMQPTFLCSCVLIWQQKITKHYITHNAFVLLVCTFFLLGFENWRNCAPSSVDASGVAKRASRNLYFRLWGIIKTLLLFFLAYFTAWIWEVAPDRR